MPKTKAALRRVFKRKMRDTQKRQKENILIPRLKTVKLIPSSHCMIKVKGFIS